MDLVLTADLLPIYAPIMRLRATHLLAYAAWFASLATLSAQSDSSPPAYSGLQILTPEVVGGASPGRLRVRLNITDNVSGFHRGSLVFRGSSPTPFVYLAFGPEARVQGSPLSGTYEVGQTLPAYFPAGTYRLEALTLWDIAGNALDLRDLPHSFQVLLQAPAANVNEYSAFPQVAFGGGWETVVYLVNTGLVPQALKIEFFSDDGLPLTLPVPNSIGNTIDVAVAQRKAAALTLQSGGPLQQGWFRTKLPTGVRSFVVFRQVVSGREDKESSSLLEKYLTTEALYACDERSGIVTGVAIANPNPDPITITMEILRDTGMGSEFRSVTIPGLGKRSFQLNPAGSSFGLFSIKLSSGGQLFSPLLIRFTPGFAFSTLPSL